MLTKTFIIALVEAYVYTISICIYICIWDLKMEIKKVKEEWPSIFLFQLISFFFFFSFLFLFSIFLIHLLFRKKFTGRIVGKKLSPGRSDVSKQFFLFGHIVILHKCTKNHDHMLYCSWDMTCDRYNFFFHFGPSLAVLPPTPRPNSLKNKI